MPDPLKKSGQRRLSRGENSIGPRWETVRDDGKISNRNRSQKNTRSGSTYKNHLATIFKISQMKVK
jgi:hypothetical protein